MPCPDFIEIDRDAPELDIIKTFGTPVFVYDAFRIKSNYNELNALCCGQAEIFFSLKANPNVSIAAQLRLLGSGAEVSSLTELQTALAAGFAPIDIIFVGPFKTDTELRMAIDARIAAIVVDSLEELSRISALSRGLDRPIPVLLRINPNFKMDDAPIKMSGVATQFGISEDIVLKGCTAFKLPGIEILGIHIYNGSRVLSATALASNIERIIALAERISEALDIEPQIVDIGGGWGVPYFASELPLDKASLAGSLRPIFESFRQRHPQCRLITESGRFLVATSGTLLARVHALKESHGERFAVIDAGYNCFMAAAGMGSVIQRNFPVRTIDTGTAPSAQDIDARPVHLAGPLCTPGDVLARRLRLNALYEGALIAIDCAGAYGPSASPVGFIGHGHPAEVLIVRQRAYLVRERDTPADLTRLQRNVFAH
ncbi:diaminopimelate decarboxylase [Burkholderia sp. Bp8963]|uniref:alanine racemase n=1 Tax=Burkholderia sp. Bp8963 TaxID=2184547 RepID=UPI000F5B5C27|nr:alanine racemase [Burkholderia sp. Bp8963]RQS70478.1 diaminopimelate decarboxylase [Burkholderia sp. Bp8963]